MKRILSMLISVIIVLNTLSLFAFATSISNEESNVSPVPVESNVPETIEATKISELGHIQRLTSEERELNTVTYLNSDGSCTAYIYHDNVKYVDSKGNVVDKSNKLSRVTSGYTNPHNDINVFYPDDFSMGITITHGSYSIRMMPNSPDLISAGKAVRTRSSKNTVPDVITYDNVFGDDTYIEYTQTFDGFKETIVLEKAIGKSTFSFSVSTNGLTLLSDNGSIYILDETSDKIVGKLNELYIWDSEGSFYEGYYSLLTVKNKQLYTVQITCESIESNKNIAYPLYIDPPLTFFADDLGVNIIDTTLFTNYNVSRGTAITYHIGDYDASTDNTTTLGTARALVKFGNIISHSSLLHYYENYGGICVKYNFTITQSLNNSATINAYMYNSYWTESTVYSDVLWNSVGDFISSTNVGYFDGTSASYPIYQLDITRAIARWRSDTTNKGILLKLSDESKKAITVSSSEASQTIHKGYITIDYIREVDGNIFRIKNVQTGNYITTHYGYDKNNVNVYMGSAGNAYNSQEFRFVYDESINAYRIFALCSMNGRYRLLDIFKDSNNTVSNGCNLQLYKRADATDLDAQTFIIEPVELSYFSIKSKSNPNVAVSANSGIGSNGGTSSTSVGNAFMQTYNGTDGQLWILEYSDTNAKEAYYEAMSVAYPFRGSSIPVRISSGYGYRVHPISGADLDDHHGIDIPASAGTPLYSIFEGTVVKIGYSGNTTSGMGHYIIIEATNSQHVAFQSTTKLRIIYMHMYESPTTTNSAVVTGATVTAETIVGKVGKTGGATGNHLHFGIITSGGTSLSMDTTENPIFFYPNITFTF